MYRLTRVTVIPATLFALAFVSSTASAQLNSSTGRTVFMEVQEVRGFTLTESAPVVLSALPDKEQASEALIADMFPGSTPSRVVIASATLPEGRLFTLDFADDSSTYEFFLVGGAISSLHVVAKV